jgi:FkbM family methyltransferase
MYHDLDFSVLPRILPERPYIVDVGANKGQSIRSIKYGIPGARISSFEPNPEFKEELTHLQSEFTDVEVHYIGLGKERSKVTFYTPVINGIRYAEETTMRLESLQEPWVVERFKQRGGQVSFDEFVAEILPGDDFDFKPDMIKIDVEGVESEVVFGFLSTIERHSPMLLIENGDWTRLHPIISAVGYRAMMADPGFDGLIPFSGTRTNTFYVKADPT